MRLPTWIEIKGSNEDEGKTQKGWESKEEWAETTQKDPAPKRGSKIGPIKGPTCKRKVAKQARPRPTSWRA